MPWAPTPAAHRSTIERYAGVAGRIIVMADPPWLDFDPIACLAENPSDPAVCAYDLETSDRDAWILDIEAEVNRINGVEVVDPTPAVCPDDPCSLIGRDGWTAHRDAHHPTRSFTLAILDDIEAWLDGIGRGRGLTVSAPTAPSPVWSSSQRCYALRSLRAEPAPVNDS